MDCHKNAEAGEPDSGSSKKEKKKRKKLSLLLFIKNAEMQKAYGTGY